MSIAVEHPRARVVASDLSNDAVAVARANAAGHGVADRVECVHTSYLEGVPGTFDVIVANPPYVRDLDRPALSRDVRHEPEVALFGGNDGLRNVAGMLDTAIARLVPGGWLAMEFGYIPATVVERGDDLVAFSDINPQAPLHVLIVPRRHISTLNDLTPADDALVGSMFRMAAALATKHGYAARGCS